MQMRNEFAGDQKDEDVAMTAHNSINRDTQGYNMRENPIQAILVEISNLGSVFLTDDEGHGKR